jgi:hypothetical protein
VDVVHSGGEASQPVRAVPGFGGPQRGSNRSARSDGGTGTPSERARLCKRTRTRHSVGTHDLSGVGPRR